MSRQTWRGPPAPPPPVLLPSLGKSLVDAWLANGTTDDEVLDLVLSLIADAIGNTLVPGRPKAA